MMLQTRACTYHWITWNTLKNWADGVGLMERFSNILEQTKVETEYGFEENGADLEIDLNCHVCMNGLREVWIFKLT